MDWTGTWKVNVNHLTTSLKFCWYGTGGSVAGPVERRWKAESQPRQGRSRIQRDAAYLIFFNSLLTANAKIQSTLSCERLNASFAALNQSQYFKFSLAFDLSLLPASD